jgi:hypothetical protein
MEGHYTNGVLDCTLRMRHGNQGQFWLNEIEGGQAQHVIQRGNNRQPIFFCDDDYALYRDRLGRRPNGMVLRFMPRF